MEIDLTSEATDLVLAQKVGTAVSALLEQDGDLLRLDVNERTITARLCDHLRPLFPDWNVDPEYNRDGHLVKRANGQVVVPDIVIHRRGTRDNLLVIELKKSTTKEPDEADLEKLSAFRESPNLRYLNALFLKLYARAQEVGVQRSLWVRT
jgi:hypothetical protein